MICGLLTLFDIDFCGAEGTRTPVQTYPSKVFYMLILVLLVGKWQEPVEPNISLAAYS